MAAAVTPIAGRTSPSPTSTRRSSATRRRRPRTGTRSTTPRASCCTRRQHARGRCCARTEAPSWRRARRRFATSRRCAPRSRRLHWEVAAVLVAVLVVLVVVVVAAAAGFGTWTWTWWRRGSCAGGRCRRTSRARRAACSCTSRRSTTWAPRCAAAPTHASIPLSASRKKILLPHLHAAWAEDAPRGAHPPAIQPPLLILPRGRWWASASRRRASPRSAPCWLRCRSDRPKATRPRRGPSSTPYCATPPTWGPRSRRRPSRARWWTGRGRCRRRRCTGAWRRGGRARDSC